MDILDLLNTARNSHSIYKKSVCVSTYKSTHRKIFKRRRVGRKKSSDPTPPHHNKWLVP